MHPSPFTCSVMITVEKIYFAEARMLCVIIVYFCPPPCCTGSEKTFRNSKYRGDEEKTKVQERQKAPKNHRRKYNCIYQGKLVIWAKHLTILHWETHNCLRSQNCYEKKSLNSSMHTGFYNHYLLTNVYLYASIYIYLVLTCNLYSIDLNSFNTQMSSKNAVLTVKSVFRLPWG